jgi:tetratricopeptide (TPR) repeat protein
MQADNEIPSLPPGSAVGSWGWKDWLLMLALVAAVLLVYQPAWQGGLLWDDDAHVTRPELRSLGGLWRIWFDIGATQQYYPLLHSFFWVQHQLWGDATLGYHLVNIALHAAVAVLVAQVLRRLAVPGAWLAAAIVALHPVQVESVAWITEQKNTLSAVFYLAAALMYLRFDQTRGKLPYAIALGLFVLGLLSKTVTATLPSALLVVFWWQRGRLSWRRDVLPLVPFFLLGAAAGGLTAWVEQWMIGAEGEEFGFTLIERFLIAGRVVWFYLEKLLWPSDLIFIYPRWHVSQAVWWQYFFPAAAFVLLAGLWSIRRRTRAPLSGLLFFGGTLFPVLGFFNVYPFRYSLVADHFQYLASLGVIAVGSAGVVLLLGRLKPWARLAGHGICLGLLLVLAILSWRQSRMYGNAERLYSTTIEQNPACWMAQNNLGLLLASSGRTSEAIEHYQQSLRVKPDQFLARNNLGNALAATGRFAEAIEQYEQALRLQPGSADPHNSLGIALAALGKTAEAIEQYNYALRLKPDDANVHNNLGNALAGSGRTDEAIAHYRAALRLKPDHAEAHNNLAITLARLGKTDEAIEHYSQALRLKPDDAVAHNNLGFALQGLGRADEAIAHYRQAVRLMPDYAKAHHNLANALASVGRAGEAVEHYHQVLRLLPDSKAAHNSLAWLLATREPANGGDPARAVPLAERACELSGQENAQCLDTLAAAYAAAGRFADAVMTAERAVQLAASSGQTTLAKNIQSRLEWYRAGRPYRTALRNPEQPKP